MDDEILSAAAQALGLDASTFSAELTTSVASLLRIQRTDGGMLGWYNDQLRRWRRAFRRSVSDGAEIPGPPVVGVLAVFTMAAEEMGSGDTEIHDRAYYPRLYRLLDVPDSEQNRFASAFRNHSESYWEALASWLEALDGDRGLPSAYALSHRFVGLPISQALVREAERKQLARAFEDMGLPAGSTISHGDMEGALDQWITTAHPPASANLKGLWSRSDARDRIVDIALVEFDNWDGIVRNEMRAAAGRGSDVRAVRLGIASATDFFETNYEFAAVIPAAGDGEYTFLATERDVPVEHTTISPSLKAIPLTWSGIDVASALSGLLQFQTGENTLSRFPRKVVPMAWNSVANLYLETERMPVGETAALLVSDEAGLPDEVQSILATIARSGFERQGAGEQGIPPGWVLFTSVQVVQPPQKSLRGPLEVLEPRLSLHMSYSGGFRLPGRITRWSLRDLPEVVVVSEDDTTLTIDLVSRDVETDQASTNELEKGQAPLLLDLNEHVTEPGDYTVVMSRGPTRLQTMSLRTRSSDETDPHSWRKVSGVSHSVDDILWPVRATGPEFDGEVVVDGAVTFGEDTTVIVSSGMQSAVWSAPTVNAPATELLHAPIPSEASCIQTGAHHFDLPRYEGSPDQRFTTGHCRKCGMSKRFPTQHWDKLLRKRDRSAASALVPPASEVVAEIRKSGRSWLPAVDAIIHLGTGSRSELSTLARQLENSAVFEHHFIRSLEALGVIETSRDSSLDVTGFEVAATAFAQLQDGSTLLTGSWARADLDEVEQLARQLPASVEVVEPDTAHLTLLRCDIDEIADAMEGDDAALAHDAGPAMLRRLPHITSVIPGLNTMSSPLMPGKTEIFSPADNRWYPYDGRRTPGAFRRRNLSGSSYYVRFDMDLDDDVVRRVPVDLCKYLAAWQAGRPLVRYDKTAARLSVPLGAPLPGLYERSSVLCSGELPLADRRTWSLHYDEIPPEFAEQLIARLS